MAELMAGELHELSAAIGGLQADVRNLVAIVRAHQEETTKEHRKVHDIVDATSNAIRNVASDVAYMKPLVEEFRDKRADIGKAIDETKDYATRKAEARGAAKLAGAMYVALGSTVALMANKAWEWLSVRPHP